MDSAPLREHAVVHTTSTMAGERAMILTPFRMTLIGSVLAAVAAVGQELGR